VQLTSRPGGDKGRVTEKERSGTTKMEIPGKFRVGHGQNNIRRVLMAKQPSGRGSVKLGKAAGAIKIKLKNVKVIDWHEVGTPNPEVIIGTVQTDVANFKKNVTTLTNLKELRDLHILINGTPWPDIAQIKFTLR
jgi:hypothetical protein